MNLFYSFIIKNLIHKDFDILNYKKLYNLIINLLNSQNSSELINNDIINLTHILINYLMLKINKIKLFQFEEILQLNTNLFELLNNKSEFIQKLKIENLGIISNKEKIYKQKINLNNLNSIGVNINSKFQNSNLNVVEIEIKDKNKNQNYNNYISTTKDLIIFSNLHSNDNKNSLRHFLGNNSKDIGTCFIYKINSNNLYKKFFILGNDITILTNKNTGTARNKPNEIKYFISSTDIKNGNINIKYEQFFKLKIKIYPFNLVKYGKGKFYIDDENIEKILNTINDIDYSNNYIIKKLMNMNINIIINNSLNEFNSLIKLKNNLNFYDEKKIKNFTFDKLNNKNNNNSYLNKLNNETNPFLYILRFLDEKNFKFIPKNKEILNIQINNLKGIENLSFFNNNLFNCLKSILYEFLSNYFPENLKENFIKILNQIAINIKRKKTTFDIIRNLVDDSIEIVKNKDSNNNNKEKEINKEKNKFEILEKIQNHIKEELKNQFFSNEEALIEICEVNKILIEKSNSEIMLKSLNSFIYKQVDNIINFNEIKKLDKNKIEHKIKFTISPYIQIPLLIIHKLLFLHYYNNNTNLNFEKFFDFLLNFEQFNLNNVLYYVNNKFLTKNLHIYGLKLYNYIFNEANKNFDFNQKFYYNNYSILSSNFSFISNDIFDNENINKIIDIKIKLYNKILYNLKNEISNLNIQKMILILNDLEKCVKLLNEDNKNKISTLVLNSLKEFYNNKNLSNDVKIESIFKYLNKIIYSLSKSEIKSKKCFSAKFLNYITENSNFIFNNKNEINKSLIKNIKNILNSLNNLETETCINFIEKLFDILMTIQDKDILNNLCDIIKLIINNNIKNEKLFEKLNYYKIYSKIGELLSKSNIKTNDEISKKFEYKIIFNATSNELDYLFLINVLYYFEEKYPTILSFYNNEEYDEKIKKMTLQEIKEFDFIKEKNNFKLNNPFIEIDTISIEIKEKKENEEIPQLKDLNPIYYSLKNKQKVMNNPSMNRIKNKNKKIHKIQEKIYNLLKIQYSNFEKYTKLENNNTLILDDEKKILQLKKNIFFMKRILFHISTCEEIGNIAVIRGFSVLKPKFNYEQSIYFSELIFKALNYSIKIPDDLFTYEDLFPPLPKLEELNEGFTNVLKETTINFANTTIVNEKYFKQIVNENSNKIELCKKLFKNENKISGEKIFHLIEKISNLFYGIINKNKKILNDGIIKDLNKFLDNENILEQNLTELLGLIYLIAGEYFHLYIGKNIMYHNKKGKISGFVLKHNDDVEIKLENDEDNKKVKINDINIDINKDILKNINLDKLITLFFKINNNNKKEDNINTLLSNLILKILYNYPEKINIENNEILHKFLDYISNNLNLLTNYNNTNNLEQNFISTFCHKLDKLNLFFNYNIFTPRFNLNFNPPTLLKSISSQVLPESDYISHLPKVSFTKALNALNNAIKFDKIVVDSIINAYKNDNFANAVAMSSAQIRSHILNGNLKEAYSDLSIVYGGAPFAKTLFTEEYDPYMITREKCIIGKIFNCNDSKINEVKKVIILLCDFINKILLVMTLNEDNFEIFWTGCENLTMINNEFPSNAYNYNKIEDEYKYALNELNKRYINEIFKKLNYEKIDNKIFEQNENLLNYLNLNLDNIDNSFCQTLIKNNNKYLNDWLQNKWKNLKNDVKLFNIELFSSIKYNNGSYYPLHYLISQEEIDNYSNIIISFDITSFLGPQATLKFYSDEEGKNLIYEIQSIKKEKYNLKSIFINYNKVYLEYIPGTTIFYSSEWFLHSRDSYLPCKITFIPKYFNVLNKLSQIFDFEDKKSILSLIINLSIEETFPISFCMRIMKILNKILNSFNITENVSIDEKFELLGINKEILNLFLKSFSEKLNEQKTKEQNLSSPYIIELSDCILNIFNSLNEPIEKFINLLGNEHKIMMKLFYFLKNIFEKKIISKEFNDKVNVIIKNYLYLEQRKIIYLKNSKNLKEDEIKKILEKYGAKINNIFDIIIISENIIVILIDYFDIYKLNKKLILDTKKEEKIEEEKVEQFWECASCHELNDKDNTFCVFCDAPKKVAPKKQVFEKKISLEDKMEDYDEIQKNLDINYCMEKLKDKIKLENYFEIIDDNLICNNKDKLNEFFKKRFNNMPKEFKESKKDLIKQFISNEEKKQFLLKTLDKNDISIDDIYLLEKNGIDLYLDISYIEDNISEINLDILINFVAYINKKNIDGNYIEMRPLNTIINYPYNILSLYSIRYYICILNEINLLILQSLPLLNPSEIIQSYSSLNNISEILINHREFFSPKIKNILLQNIIDFSEYDEDLINIPTFKVDRINNLNQNNKSLNNNPFMFSNKIVFRNYKPLEEIDNYQSINTFFNNLIKNKTNEIKFKQQGEFLQVFNQFQKIDIACLRSKKIDRDHIGFKIEYLNEFVQGISGPYRQFFSDISEELQNNDKLTLLIPTQNNLNKKGEFKDKFTLNNKSTEYSQFEFLGTLMGICIRTGVYLTINLTSLIWKKIINQRITDFDIKMFDEGLFNLNNILLNEKDKNKFEEIFNKDFNSIVLSDGSTFTIPEKDLLKFNNFENLFENISLRKKLLEYINDIHLNESKLQIESIKKGISKVLPLSILQFYTYSEIEKLICGENKIDIDLLKKNTIISSEIKSKEYLVKWLWEILEEMTEEEKINFIKFCYAQERLPSTQDEYNKRQIQFSIKYNNNNKKDLLPRADTCFFFLILGDYTSKEKMKKLIGIAISMDNVGMNGDKVEGNNLNSRANQEIFEIQRDKDNSYDVNDEEYY